MKAALIAASLVVAVHFGYSPHDGAHLSIRGRTEALKQIPAASSEKKPAPDFVLKSLDGPMLRLSDFRGKAVLVNFWATWCTPCKVEMPWLVELYRQYHAAGLEILGVSLDDAGEEARIAEFVKKHKVNYPILIGNDAVAGFYGGVRYLPQTFFIDRQGNIVRSSLGFRSKEDFDGSIKQLLSENH
ncbi:MAG TPA: TlpA disulfide reductase family protein [Candidatus Angelobacter sp.]|nr:TlpA disulfide reductase family protein [Candidatus Angelobacter sp.]